MMSRKRLLMGGAQEMEKKTEAVSSSGRDGVGWGSGVSFSMPADGDRVGCPCEQQARRVGGQGVQKSAA